MQLFVTNREIQEHPDGSEIVREDGKETASEYMRFGVYENKTFKLFSDPELHSEINYEGLKGKKIKELKGSAAFFKKLYDEMSDTTCGKNDVLFFVHGFNTDLQGVREAFDTLQKLYVDPEDSTIGHIVIFTWPGRSPKLPLHYRDDKLDAISSGSVLGRLIEKTAEFLIQHINAEGNPACGRNMHLMVHSMGTRVLRHAMLHLQRDGERAPELFNQILLMASDIEYDIFEPGKPFDNLIDLGYRIHVYVHEKDWVLGISKHTKNFSNRLGMHGRKHKHLDPDVIEANVTQVQDDLDRGLRSNQLNHWYYYSSSAVVEDVLKVLGGGVSNYKV